jgi:hypothetical protein
MRKKEENCCCEEGCPCGNPMNLGAILIAINLIISIIVLCTVNQVKTTVTDQREMTIAQVGGEESYNKMKAIYASEKYQEEQGQNSSLDEAYNYYVNGTEEGTEGQE